MEQEMHNGNFERKLVFFFPNCETVDGVERLSEVARRLVQSGKQTVCCICSGIQENMKGLGCVDWADQAAVSAVLADNTDICIPAACVMPLLLCLPERADYRILPIMVSSDEKQRFEACFSNRQLRIRENVEECWQMLEAAALDLEKVEAEKAAQCLVDGIAESKLTVVQLAQKALFARERKGYLQYKKLLPRSSVPQYIDFLRQQKAAEEQGPLRRVLFLPRKAVGKAKKKIQNAVGRRCRAWKDKRDYKKVIRHYDRVLPVLKEKLAREGKLKAGFVVLFSSTFTYRPIFEAMMQSAEFEPYVIVVPDVSRSPEFRTEQFTRAFEELSEKYPGRVVKGYDPQTDTHVDIGESYSVLFFANPYGHMVAPEYQIRRFWKKNVLMLYAYYGFGAVTYGRQVMQTDVYNSVWKLLLDTELSLEDLKMYQPVRGMNGLVTGYVKMDELAQIPVETNRRKRVLVCPHHTVMDWTPLNISNFRTYAQQILELPRRYPEIDFVFRPHPMLFDNLRKHRLWTEEQIEAYLDTIERTPNMAYSVEGDYMELFVNSDAMIHDCSSFIGEYLFTEHPCCYMFKQETRLEDVYTPLGIKCLENYYPAHSWQDVTDFIDHVVLGGQDPMKETREQFVRGTLKIGYPNGAKRVVQMIKDAILNS